MFHAVGDIRVEDVDAPRIQEPTDAIVRLTASAICGTELIELTRSGAVDPAAVLTDLEAIADAENAYEEFDRRAPGWIKIELEPSETAAV